MHFKKLALIAIDASFMTAFAGVAVAAPLDLTGQTGTFGIYYPNTSTLQSGVLINFTAGAGQEGYVQLVGNIDWTLDISGSTLTFGFNDHGCCTSPTTFSGPIVTFTGGSFPGLTGVTLLSTDIAGFNASRITFNNNTIFVNIQGGLDLQNNRSVVLEAMAAPEPDSYQTMLVGLGLAACVIWVMRSRRLMASVTR